MWSARSWTVLLFSHQNAIKSLAKIRLYVTFHLFVTSMPLFNPLQKVWSSVDQLWLLTVFWKPIYISTAGSRQAWEWKQVNSWSLADRLCESSLRALSRTVSFTMHFLHRKPICAGNRATPPCRMTQLTIRNAHVFQSTVICRVLAS